MKTLGEQAWSLAAVAAVALVFGLASDTGAKEKGKSPKDLRGKWAEGLYVPVDYFRAKWRRIHFKPEIDKATNEQCLVCHKEILTHKPREKSPAGWRADSVLAWYQTLDTYEGPQMTFHARHLTSKYARQVMDLKCNFCHQGHDPRDEAPNTHANNQGVTSFTLRKTVNPEKTCLRCHGAYPYKLMDLPGPWPEIRKDFESEETPNGCLTCHAEMYRTVRHQVTYLKPKNIEKLAKKSSDVCYGCHGGRAWYRISYPYPRHPWPTMKEYVPETPEWAKNRPTQSEERYRRK